jgi:predicted amino acid dehydrogenase
MISTENENKIPSLRRNITVKDIRNQLSHDRGFAFIFHVTSWDTLRVFFNNMPDKDEIEARVLWNTPPFIGSAIYENNNVIGANIVMPVPIELWINSPNMIKQLRHRQFFPALQLARQCGLSIAALGGSTPYICNYGKLDRPFKIPYITTGHAATAAALKKWAILACERTQLEFSDIRLAIFGAAGRLGKAVSRYIAHGRLPREIILIDLPNNINLLKKLAAEIRQHNGYMNIKVSTHGIVKEKPLPSFDGAILVSNNTVPYLTAEDLRKAHFWIDDSHPRAASIEAEESARHETLYIECYLSGPDGLNTDTNFNLPSTNDCYTCFAEGYIAWKEQITEDYITGIPNITAIENVALALEKYQFNTGPFFGKGGVVLT